MARGAKWLKADLHMHTPSIGQYFTMPDGEAFPETTEEYLNFAKRYVKQAHEEAGLDLIAITNHNDTSWIKYLQAAAEELYGDDFVVLPGLEIGADSGLQSIHVLAIFPEKTTPETLERFLDDDLELPITKRFNANGDVLPTVRSFLDVLRAVDKRGGLAIAAHAFSSDNSLLGSKSNKGDSRRQQFLHPELKALDLSGVTLEQLSKKESGWGFWLATNQHRDPDFRRERAVALLNNSDARRLEGVGENYSWIKGEKPCFETLKNALLDPEDRIRLKDEPPEDQRFWSQQQPWRYQPPRNPTSHLEKLQIKNTSSGFLRGLSLPFHPGLNCLIGGRGTGKSSVIELIRYLWDYSPLIDDLKGFEEVFLPTTGYASLDVIRFGSVYRISRDGQNKSVVERNETSGNWVQVEDVVPDDILPLRIYGQKEILHTSRDIQSQLELLDRLVGSELDELKREQITLKDELKKNRRAISSDYNDFVRMKADLKERPSIQERLRAYDELGLADKAELKRQYDTEDQLWDNALKQVKEARATIQNTQKTIEFDNSLLEDEEVSDLPNNVQFKDLRKWLEKLKSEIEESYYRPVLEQIEQGLLYLDSVKNDWQINYSRIVKEYKQALEELPDVTPDEIVKLEKRLGELNQTERELTIKEASLREKLNDRQKLLEEFLGNAEQQYKLRKNIAEKVSSQLSRIRVNVNFGGDVQVLAKHLQEKFAIKMMRAAQYKALANQCGISPVALLAHVENADESHPNNLQIYKKWLPEPSDDKASHLNAIDILSEKSGLKDVNWSQKLINRLDFEERLKLDEFLTPDRVTIEVNIARENQSDNWRPLGKSLGQGVSVGQGCTAILSIILLESEEPLIIDQPEDDLDNRFIYDEVVGLLRKERGKRQIIVATHNANVPVAGDAEMIFALDTEEVESSHGHELNCTISAQGYIDNQDVSEQVTLVLEGGQEAFILRRQKYGF